MNSMTRFTGIPNRSLPCHPNYSARDVTISPQNLTPSGLPLDFRSIFRADGSQITLDPKGPSSISGVRGSSSRPALLFSLLEPIAQYLPSRITFYGSDHDLGSTLLGDDQFQAIMKAVGDRRYISEDVLKGFEQGVGKGEVKGVFV